MSSPHAPSPPRLSLLLAEAGVVRDVVRHMLAPRRRTNEGEGRPAMVIPGFLARDWMTRPLRRALADAGYRVAGWGLGRNTGVRASLFDELAAKVEAHGRGRAVALVGWSLGGLYAREVAKRRPELVERVVTLGSPFSGDFHANNAWRLYEQVAGHSVDAPPVALDPAPKPRVLTFALWSPRDGIVAPATARGLEEESDVRVEVDCRHTAFVVSPEAIAAVLRTLAVPLR